MTDNRDECPFIMGAPDAQGSPFVDTNLIRMFLFCCCCNAADECPSWTDKFKGSARRGRECSASLVKQAVANFGWKWRNLFRRLKKTARMSNHSSRNHSKSGRFQYDALSYALNFDDGSVDEDEYSLRAFSARFACPTAKPRETDCPLVLPTVQTQEERQDRRFINDVQRPGL